MVFITKNLIMAMVGLGISAKALGQNAPINFQGTPNQRVVGPVEIFEDPSHKFQAQTIQTQTFKNFADMEPVAYSDSVFWLRFKVESKSSEALNVYAQLPTYHEFSVYVLRQGRLVPLLSENERYNPHWYTIDVGTTVFYVKLSTHMPVHFGVTISLEKVFTQFMLSESILISLGIGCMVALLFFNLFLYLSLRDPLYLNYLFFVGINLVINLQAAAFPKGINTMFGADLLSMGPLIRPLAPVSTVLFAIAMLRIPETMRILNRVFQVIIGIFVILAVCFLTIPGASIPVNSILDPLFLLVILLLMYAGVRAWIQGQAAGKYFTIAIFSFIVSIGLYLANQAGAFEKNLPQVTFVIFGQAVEMILMSLALANRISILETEKTVAEVKAQEAERLRHLIRIIGHDINNALSIVSVALGMVKVGRKVEGNVERMERGISNMVRIVQYVLKTEAMRSGKAIIQLERVSLAKVFNEVAFMYEKKSRDKGVDIDFILEDDFYVMAEETTLQNEVISNLVSNALKFSFSQQKIRVEANGRNDSVIITVADQGVGIPKNNLSKLFEDTTATSTRGTSGETGTGFGLPLVRKFVQQYDGKISVRSFHIDTHKETHGTVFEIVLKKVK